MSLEGQVLSAVTISPVEGLWIATRLGVLLLATLYFVFSLIVVRQVSLMSETVTTQTAPILKAFAIIHAGFALGVIILFIGFLFGNA